MKKSVLLTVILFISCGVSLKQKGVQILQKGIKDESAIIRVNAARGLKQIGDAQGMIILYEVLKGDDRDGVVASIGALYELGEQTLSPVIIKLAESKDPLIRTEAYRLIAVINDAQCRDILVKGIDDNIAKIRKFSYIGLEKFKDKKFIRNGLRDVGPLVRIAAAEALGNLGEKGMENFVKKEMEVINIEIWKHGILTLAEIGDTSAISFIKGVAVDTPWELKLTAAEALLKFNDDEGIIILKEGLMSNDPFTRIAAVKILKKYNIPETVELLKQAVKDEYINISVGAIEALAVYHARECKEVFAEMMDAPNPLVKIAAATAYLQSE